MKKTKQFITILLMMILLGGCGNKSKEELTDIEQFRCQDSIQTVFDVLGEIEMETSAYVGENYTYENLNLYGYDGKAIFRVRDDKETISSFECSLKLNKKEFEDVLSQLEDKYGEYEKSEYTNQITYAWEFSEDKAEEMGYNEISLSDNGDKKVYVKFWDEWSGKKDDAYYKHLEEDQEETEERETLARKTYSYDDGNEATFLLSKDKENKFHLTISLNIDEKWKAAYAFTVLCNTIQIDALKEVNAVVILQCGDDTLTSSGLSVDSSGKLIKNSEWLTEGMTSEEFDSQAAEALLDNIKDSFSDFITNEMRKYLS